MNQVTYVIYAIIVVVIATVISHSPTRDRNWGSSGGSYFSSGSSYGGGSYGGGSFHK
jgi:uncharacterized membrane protein YgcG